MLFPTRAPVRGPVSSLSAPPSLDATRRAVLGLFLVNGLTLSAWIARVPAVRDALGLSPATLGALLISAAIGSLAATAIAPLVVARTGIATGVRLSGALFGVGYLFIGVGVAIGSIPAVAVGLLLNGVAFAGGNLPLNLASTDVERRVGRPILPQFHAAFSIGTVGGSLLGAAAAALAVPLLAQLVVMAGVAIAWRWHAARVVTEPEHRLTAAPTAATASSAAPTETVAGRRRPSGRGTPRRARPAWLDARALLVGVVGGAAAMSEGAANDWLALGVVDGFDAPQSVGAVVFGVFVGAMTLVRLGGTRLLDRFGRDRVLRGSALVSIAGIVVFVTAPALPIAVAGVAAWGAGAALNFPIAVSAASDDPRLAAARVSVMAGFGSLAGLVGPVLLGAVGQQVGVRSAIAVIAVVLVAVVVVAPRAAGREAGLTLLVPDDEPELRPALVAGPAAGSAPAERAA